MHERPNALLSDRYPASEYFDDLLRVTDGVTDEELARMTIWATADLLSWMESCGARFQPSLSGTLSLSRTNAFFLGGGKALMNSYYAMAEKIGIDVSYDTEVQHLEIENGRFRRALVRCKGFPAVIAARTMIAVIRPISNGSGNTGARLLITSSFEAHLMRRGGFFAICLIKG
jgi:tricarballylate dehydrogenase